MTAQPTILLVDDSPLVHHVYGPQLVDAGFHVVHAEDGVAAINAAFQDMPDVIVLDIYMPKINGYQVCRLLKDHAETKGIPIILMTGGAARQLVANPRAWSFETGADVFVEKGEMDIVATVRPYCAHPHGAHRAKGARRPMSESDIMTALSTLLDKQLYRDVSHLQELNEKKSAFVSLVAHELRAPLAIVKGSLENLAGGVCGTITAAQQESIAVMERTIDRLARLIRELLDLAQIEAGRLVLRRESLDLGALLREVISAYQGATAAQQVILEYIPAAHPVAVLGDRDRLEQVLINLLTNAITHTPSGGLIRLHLHASPATARLTVTNSGPGIPPADCERIFHLFERLDSTDGQGVGLGLPIARTIVDLHGGRLWAESDGVQGATFIVELPVDGYSSPRAYA